MDNKPSRGGGKDRQLHVTKPGKHGSSGRKDTKPQHDSEARLHREEGLGGGQPTNETRPNK